MRIRCIVFVTLLFMGAYGLVGAQSISLDHTDGLADATHMNTGVPVIFYLRLTGDADAHGGVANGFKVYSPDGATWTTSVGDTTGTLGKTQFDGGFFINPFSITGSNADTLGFAGFRFFGAGLPIGFDDVAYTIEIGPIPAGDAGKQICLDSAFYPPSGVWKWAGVDVFPDWDGPHCFTVGAAAECVVDVTFPNGGETVTVGDGMNITWTTADCLDCDFVDISYSVDGGGFTTIVSGTPNDGSHGWTAPDEQSSNVVVKVCCQASGHCAESGPFTIEAIPCTIVVTSPSNGDTWTHGDLVSIQWTSDCPCDMNIQISVDGGTSWGYLAGPMANSGQFDWTVTDAYESNTVKVRVLCTDASASGASDGLFSIVAPPPTNIVLSIPVMTGDNCDSVCIPITADAFTGVAGVELHLNYDPACMTCIGIDPGVLAGATVNCDAGGAHIIWEDFANPLTLPDGATIASVCFTGLSEAVCAVGFDETCELVDEVGDPLVASYNDGSLNCEPPPPSDIMLTLPNMTADNCDSACIPITVESFEGVAGVELHLNYDASCMLCADIDVGYLAGATVNCEEGAVHIIWEDFANPLSLPDGETLASVCFTGLSEAACSVGFDATSELVDELGDPLAASYNDGSLNCEPPPPSDIMLTLPNMTADNCDSACIPITVESFAGVAGVELHLNYDASCMLCADIDVGYLAGATVNCEEGAVHIIWEDFANPLSLPDGETLASVCFTGLSEAACPVGFDATSELVDELGDPLAASYNDGSLNCTPVPECVTTVVNPNGGEVLTVGETVQIQWTYTDGPPGAACECDAFIEFTTDGGTTWITIDPGAPGGTYDWVVPDRPSATCLIRVCCNGPQWICDVSDNFFTIQGPPPSDIVLTLPEMVADNCDYACIPVTVEGFNGVAGVELHFDYDAGCMTCSDFDLGYLTGATVNCEEGAVHIIWEDFANPLTLPDGETLVSICFDALSESACPIGFTATSELVDELGDPLAASYNDGSLSCTPGAPCVATVISPNGGETWTVGDVVEINWTLVDATPADSFDCPATIDISFDGGATWTNIATNQVGSSFNWTVTDNPSTNCLIRGCCCAPDAECDVSDAPFTIQAPQGGCVPPAICLDHVDGLDAANKLIAGGSARFHLRVKGDADEHGGVANGFRVFSPDGATWSLTIGDTTGTLGKTQFDGGFFINDFSITGMDADTIGFGGFRFFSTGLPPLFNDIAYTLVIGPIGAGDAGKNICLDSAFYPPSGVWKWAGIDIFPNWDGPHCYEISGEQQPCTLAVTSPIAGDSLEIGSTWPITWETDCDCSYTIEVSTDGGANWNAVASGVPGSPFNWTVPNSPTEFALVRVCCDDGSTCDASGRFTIYETPPPPRIVLTVPDVVVDGCGNGCVPILVQSFNAVAGVELHLTFDDACMDCDVIDPGYLVGATTNCLPGELHIIWEDFANPLTLPDGEALLNLCFTNLSEAPCPIAFEATSELVDDLGDPLDVIYFDGSLAGAGCGDCVSPFSFTPTAQSGVFRGQATIEGIPAEAGDYVAAFDEDGNCAGAVEVTINAGLAYIILPIYGDDDLTPGVDEGMNAGENFTLKIYDCSADAIIDYCGFFDCWLNTNGTPIPGPCGDVANVYDFQTTFSDAIQLRSGWNLISFDILFGADDPASVFASLGGCLVYVTDFDGGSHYYDPNGPPFLNTLHQIRPGYGYWVKVCDDILLAVDGICTYPCNFKLDLDNGWNLIAYWPQATVTPAAAFADLINAGALVYVTGFDGGSQYFDPNGPPFLNTLTQIRNGFGYWVKVNAAWPGFQYEECDVAGVSERPTVSDLSLNEDRSGQLGPFAFTPTNLSAALSGSVTVNDHAAEEGDLIAAFDEAGNCVGAARLFRHNDAAYFSMPIYGDDQTTPSLDEGMNSDESYHLMLLDASTGEIVEHGVELTGWVNTNGAPLQEPVVFNFASSARLVGEIPDEYTLSQNYPNPFNPATTIRFGLPVPSQVELSVYNIVGQKVATLVTGAYQAGLHEVQWRGVDQSGVPVASGVYFYRLTTDAYNETKKMLLLK